MNYLSMLKRVLVSAMIPVMLFLALASWGVASPVAASPDDDYHLASIWCGQGLREGLCEAGDTPQARQVPQVLNQLANCYKFNAAASANCLTEPSDVLILTTRGSFDGGYPPIFYGVMSIFASENISASVIAMRTANAFLFVGLATVLFFALPRKRRDPLVISALVALVPLGMFLVPSTNPSSWAVISAMTLWLAVLGFFAATSVRKRIVLGGVATLATVMGAGARSDAAVYSVLAMIVATVLSFERSRRFVLLLVLPALLSVIAAVLFLGSGQSSVVQPDAFTEGASRSDVLILIGTNLQLLPQLWAGALGTTGLGWLDTLLPGLVWFPALASFSALVFWGLQTVPLRKGLSVLMVFGSLIVVPMYILVNDRVLVGTDVQPRYIYPLMIMLVGVAVLQLRAPALRFSRVQMFAVAFALAVANGTALHINLRRYTTGIDVGGFNLNNGYEWWWNAPVMPMTIWAAGTLAFAVFAFAVAAFLTSRNRDNMASSLIDRGDAHSLR